MNLEYGTARHESLVAEWLEHPNDVRKVIGSIPVGDSDFFFVPRSRHVDHFISHFFTELKIYHFSLFIRFISYFHLFAILAAHWGTGWRTVT